VGARPAPGLALLALLAAAHPALAQEPAKEKTIQDNSFLMEESYNQEVRVVQHISSFTFASGSHDAVFTFTQEWPAGGLAHQLSYTIPLQNLPETGGGTRFGDVALNYRYQLLGDGDAKVACAPRFTVMLPTGSARRGYGNGTAGYQVDVPVSVVLTPRFVTHVNAGLTLVPHAKDPDGEKATTFGQNLGWSLVWLTHPTLNFLLEVVYTRGQDVTGSGTVETRNHAVLSPGVRWAYNYKSGLQIVPGIAFPIGVGPSAGEKSVLLYLSFEHPY
jgi:hypothetical protein